MLITKPFDASLRQRIDNGNDEEQDHEKHELAEQPGENTLARLVLMGARGGVEFGLLGGEPLLEERLGFGANEGNVSEKLEQVVQVVL